MVLPLKRWLHRLKFILLFLVLSYALYHVLEVVSTWIEPQKYKEPDGNAVKAFQHELGEEPYDSVAERLRLFYWYGE